jgi:hypothetical protein
VSAAQPQPESNSGEVDALLELCDPSRPTRRLPLELRRLLPDPLKSDEDFERFAHADLAGKTAAQRAFEALQIRTAAALIPDADRVPTWLLTRLERLAAA